MAEKTSTNVYSHFRDPCNHAPTMAEPPPAVLGEKAFSGHMEDFHHLHQVVINFGSPEVADQMSGNVYMHAGVVEDECSKCIRLIEKIGEFSINDLKEAVTCLTWWGSDAQHSMALRDVVEAVDRTTVDRLLSLHFSLEPQWKLYSDAEFPLEVHFLSFLNLFHQLLKILAKYSPNSTLDKSSRQYIKAFHSSHLKLRDWNP